VYVGLFRVCVRVKQWCRRLYVRREASMDVTYAQCIMHVHCYGVATISSLLKFLVFFAKVPYKRDHILPKRPVILRSLIIVATPYNQCTSPSNGCDIQSWAGLPQIAFMGCTSGLFFEVCASVIQCCCHSYHCQCS